MITAILIAVGLGSLAWLALKLSLDSLFGWQFRREFELHVSLIGGQTARVWVLDYAVTNSDAGMQEFRMTGVGRPRVLGFQMAHIAMVQLGGTRLRLRRTG